MTLAPPDRTTTSSDVDHIDLRCASRPLDVPAADGTVPVPATRCQLLAGHGGEHAIMYAAAERRRVLVWTGSARPHPAADDWRALPWMRGCPVPAWFDAMDSEARR